MMPIWKQHEMKQVFDHEFALRATGGDPALLAELVSLFREQSPKWMSEIAEAIGSGIPERVRKTAHTIKGSLASLGGEVAAEAALNLETMSHSGQFGGAGTAYQSLLEKVRDFEKATADLERVSPR